MRHDNLPMVQGSPGAVAYSKKAHQELSLKNSSRVDGRIVEGSGGQGRCLEALSEACFPEEVKFDCIVREGPESRKKPARAAP